MPDRHDEDDPNDDGPPMPRLSEQLVAFTNDQLITELMNRSAGIVIAAVFKSDHASTAYYHAAGHQMMICGLARSLALRVEQEHTQPMHRERDDDGSGNATDGG